LKILVFVKTVPDTKIPLECVEETGRLKNDWNVPILNPDDAAALAEALRIRNEIADAHITVVHLGPSSGERFLRDALALGCDHGVRIWDEGLNELCTESKVTIFSRVAEILGFDLLLTGTKSLDSGNEQLGILLASALHVPFIRRVCSIDTIRGNTVTATRLLERGYRERVESSSPLIVSMGTDEVPPSYAAFTDLARAAGTPIQCFDLPVMGIPRETLQVSESRLKLSPLRLPEPRLQYIQPPDSSLPAFERRRQIGEGSVGRRKGRVVKGDEDTVVEELFQTLLQHGFLDHLKKNESEEA